MKISGRTVGRLVGLLTLAAVLLNLPGPAAVAADPLLPPDLQPTQCFLDLAGTVSCPQIPAPADLVPPAVMTGLRPDAADALRAFSDQAIEEVLDRYDLPDSDRDQVLGYARYDALAALWGLIGQSFETPKAQRTARQQAVVDWLGRRVQRMRAVAPPFAAREYAKFAGKNLNQFDNLLEFGGSEEQIRDFLSGTPEPFDTADTAHATGGYCRYRPPAPYTDEFDGHTLQTCFTPCTSPFGCVPTVPSYDQFVKWGNTHVGSLFDAQTVTDQSALIAGSTVAAGAVAGTAAGAALLWMGSTIFPFATATGALTAFSVAAIASVPAVVLAAVAIAAVAGINVATIDQMAGKLAAAIAQSRQPVDADALWATADGKATLYTLFVDAVSPAPRQDITCDNAHVTEIWKAFNSDGYYKPFAWELDNFNFKPCLNPPAIPAASPTDPFFVVTPQGGGATTETPSITFAHPDLATATTMRLRGDNWIVAQKAGGAETEALHVNITDWQGRTNLVWLQRTADGYTFHGIRAAADGSLDIDPTDCTNCWSSDHLEYVGPDGGHRSATVGLYQPPTGQPTYTGSLLSNQQIAFDANGFKPGGAVGAVTYSWQFQKDGCGNFPCIVFENLDSHPDWGDPEPGATGTHTWQQAGGFYALLTATDSEGRTATSQLFLPISSPAPETVLARDCSFFAFNVACNNYPAQAGDSVLLWGGATMAAKYDTIEMRIDWGDGTGNYQLAGFGAFPVPGSPIELKRQADDRSFLLNARHQYTAPGVYNITVSTKNQQGRSTSRTVTWTITGKQQVTFDQLDDRRYGDVFDVAATGSDSGLPVTYTAGPADVCTAGGVFGAEITAVGVGDCTVTARQPGGNAIWLDADPVSRTFHVSPAPLTITAEDKQATYGGALPTLTATVDGLVADDTRADLGDLALSGPPAGSDAGSYDITASGATNPRYDISYVTGTLTIAKAPLTVTAADRTRVYGDPLPTYSADLDGLVNGDSTADITGLSFAGPAKAAGVGEHAIVVSGADNPNYAYTYVPGTETITPAPLRITADDVTRRYGAAAAYSATFEGLVNADGADVVTGLQYAGAPASADVGDYPIVLSGGSNPNYTITRVGGTEHVTPAPLTITADDATRRYGAAAPSYTATLDGLTNGDQPGDVHGLVLTGAPAGAGVGAYAITPSGAADPNYAISFVPGTETVTPAPLTVTANDASKVYGAPHPAFSARFDGLVNGDSGAAITGLGFDSVPASSDVGSYPLVPRHATNPNYDYTYVAGTETITRAPLTIRAQDQTVRYGATVRPTWTGVGWVNGDSDATIGTAPTCTVAGAAPGPHLGAITCSGAADPNYAIGYAAGTLTVNPVIRLQQVGLPAALPHRATVDQRPVDLPSGDVEVSFGTAHSYAFPPVVVGGRGGTYLTRTPSFTGPVATNLDVTARYVTMAQVITAQVDRGRIDGSAESALRTRWAKVRLGLGKGQARAAVQRFAREVHRLTGDGVRPSAARVLLAHAQLVYTYVDGRGSL